MLVENRMVIAQRVGHLEAIIGFEFSNDVALAVPYGLLDPDKLFRRRLLVNPLRRDQSLNLTTTSLSRYTAG